MRCFASQLVGTHMNLQDLGHPCGHLICVRCHSVHTRGEQNCVINCTLEIHEGFREIKEQSEQVGIYNGVVGY